MPSPVDVSDFTNPAHVALAITYLVKGLETVAKRVTALEETNKAIFDTLSEFKAALTALVNGFKQTADANTAKDRKSLEALQKMMARIDELEKRIEAS